MSVPSSLQGPPITDKRQLILYHEAGNKPPAAWRIGTEHEKFVFRRADLRRVPYDGPDGIRALLQGMTRFGWKPVASAGSRSSKKATSSACRTTTNVRSPSNRAGSSS